MPRISAIIITLNEEKNIARCLDSLLEVADDIVVLDSYSTDDTESICRNRGVRFVQRPWESFTKTRQHAATLATYPHHLVIDADEVLSPTLIESILEVKKNWQFDAYFLNRITSYCGHWVKYCGWYPDEKLRLYDSRKGAFGGDGIHEKVEMLPHSTTGYLRGDLLHYSFHSINQHIDTINRYSLLKAESWIRQNRRPLPGMLLLHPLWKFIRTYFLKCGFCDGRTGLIISINSAHSTFLTEAKFRILYQNKSNKHPSA